MIRASGYVPQISVVVGFAAGGAAFVVLERDEARFNEARELGYLCWQGDATDEAALMAVGVTRARLLTTVLPNDAALVREST